MKRVPEFELDDNDMESTSLLSNNPLEEKFEIIKQELLKENHDVQSILSKLNDLKSHLSKTEDGAGEDGNIETFYEHITTSAREIEGKELHHDSIPSSKRKLTFVISLYLGVFLKAISWGVSSVLLVIAALTVANPFESDDPSEKELFIWLVILIITSATSDCLDQKLNVVTSGKVRPDVFWFKYIFWTLLELVQLVASVFVTVDGLKVSISQNIHLLIGGIGIVDSSLGLFRILLEVIAVCMGPKVTQTQFNVCCFWWFLKCLLKFETQSFELI